MNTFVCFQEPAVPGSKQSRPNDQDFLKTDNDVRLPEMSVARQIHEETSQDFSQNFVVSHVFLVFS